MHVQQATYANELHVNVQHVHLALQFSDNVRTFFSKCNTKRPVDLFTNTVTKETKLVLEAVT